MPIASCLLLMLPLIKMVHSKNNMRRQWMELALNIGKPAVCSATDASIGHAAAEFFENMFVPPFFPIEESQCNSQ